MRIASFTLMMLCCLGVSMVFSQNYPAHLKEVTHVDLSQLTLTGIITDSKTGKPVEGATVYIADLKLGALTNANGQYIFTSLPAGNYLVEIKSIGYKATSKTIRFTTDGKENFSLDEDFVEGNEVVVTGLSKATQIKRSPVPVVAVSHDYLVHNLSTNAMEALAKIPGIRTVTTGPNVSKPFIRGLGYNRILTLYDGVRLEGQQWGDEHGIEVDQYGVERIEVIKGPASLSYGSDALAGVVNIIPTQPAVEGKINGDVTMDYQTNNKYLGGSVMLSETEHGVEWLSRLSHKQAANYQNKYDGHVFGTAFNETDANASIGIHGSWGYSHLAVVLFDDVQEIPNGSRDSATRKFTRQIDEAGASEIVSYHDLTTYKIEPLHQHVQYYRGYLSNNFILGNSRLAVNIGFQKSVRREFSHPILSNIPGLYLQLNSLSYDIKYSFPEIHEWNITAGINGMLQTNTVTNGTEFIIPNYHQFDIGAFVAAKRSFNKLDISGGIRYDIRSFRNDELYTGKNSITGFDMPLYGTDTIGAAKSFSNYHKIFSGITGSIGATYNFSQHVSVKANVSRGFRSPNISEISANGVHPGTNMYQIGNPNFKSEFSLQEDIGFDYSSKYIVASVSIFNNYISNYIYNQKLVHSDGTDVILVPGNQTFQFQASRANLYGGELSIDIHPIKAFHFENSFSVVYGNNKGVKGKPIGDSAKYLPFIPPAHGTSEIRIDFEVKSAHITKGFVKAQVEFYAAQERAYTAFGTETATPAYALFNAGVGGGIANKKGKIICNIYLMANNLFDVAYQDHLSRLKYFEEYPGNISGRNGIYNMGRNVSLKVDLPLGFNL